MIELNMRKKPTILVVDDTPDNLILMNSLLSPLYRTKVATSGEKALEIARSDDPPDLILLDVIMPYMDGYEVCRWLKRESKTASIPVIFLTSLSDVEDEEKGLEVGAIDYITKPMSPPIVLARVKTHLALKNVQDFLVDKSLYLEREVQKRTQELGVIQDVAMMAIGSLAETRDNETGKHIRRTQHYVRELATRLAMLPAYEKTLTPEAIVVITKSAPLHDIGKIGIPDSILLKPGKLTPEEFEIMKTHAAIGRDAIIQAESLLGTTTSFLKTARDIAGSHHERWDGKGYPLGLSQESIPVAARIMSLADVYDAVRSKRVYKEALTHEEAVEVISSGAGTQFDPHLVRVFLDASETFRKIAKTLEDD